MLKLLKRLIGQDKAQLSGIIQGRLLFDTVRELEKFTRRFNLTGNVRVIRESYAEFILEGARAQLDRFLKELPQCNAMKGKTMKVGWADYTGKHTNLRFSWE